MLGRRLKLWFGRMGLARRLERALPPAALAIMGALADAGHEVGLVGGCVRDLLLGIAPKDWDMATSAGTEALLALFPEGRLMGVTRGGNTVLIPREGAAYEVTPYRGDGLLADLSRRDFTINAMALGLDVTLHDPLGGQADLARRVVRACGDPAERLREDPLRMLRAVRLAAQLNFTLDPAVAAVIPALAPLLDTVAPERVGAEFARLLVTERPAPGVEQLRTLGLLGRFAPELLEGVGMEQNRYHAYPVWEHCLMALSFVPPEPHLRLAALLQLIGADLAEQLLERLRFDKETRRRVVHLVRYHMDLHMDGPVSDSAIRRMIGRIGLAQMGDLIQVRRAECLASGKRAGDLSPETVYLLRQVERVLAEDAALRVTDLAVSGADVLRAFGRPPGAYVGEVLAHLLDEVLEEPAHNTREHLLARLAEISKL